MAPFDWVAFCRTRGVPFITEGHSVTRGNIGVRCPFCGDDSGEHMGMSTNKQRPYWNCWRNPTHRGRDPTRLIAALLHCSWEVAQSIVADSASEEGIVDRYELALQRFRQEESTVTVRARPCVDLAMPKEFQPIIDGGYGSHFYRYLHERGFTQIDRLVGRYDLRYCLTGYFRWRLIVPIYHNGFLVSWTGRDITGHAERRYSTLSDDAEVAEVQGYPPAIVNLKHIVLNADLAVGGVSLVVCEGPMDALKVDFYAPRDTAAVALFGMPELVQLAALRRLAANYKHYVVLLDGDATSRALRFANQLQRGALERPVLCMFLPDSAKDPGELSNVQIRRLFSV